MGAYVGLFSEGLFVSFLCIQTHRPVAELIQLTDMTLGHPLLCILGLGLHFQIDTRVPFASAYGVLIAWWLESRRDISRVWNERDG